MRHFMVRTALLSAAAVVIGGSIVKADSVNITIDQTASIIGLDTPLTPDAITVSVSGSGTADVVLDSTGKITHAGLTSLSGWVIDPIDREIPFMSGILTINIAAPANTIQYAANGAGTTANPVTGGLFTQSDIGFNLLGTIDGTMVGSGGTAPISMLLSDAQITDNPGFIDASIVADSEGRFIMTLPLDITLDLPLMSDQDPIGSLPLTISGSLVANGVLSGMTPQPPVAAVPLPSAAWAGAGLLGLLGVCGWIQRRKSGQLA